MKRKFGIQQTLMSLGVFAIVILALVSVDERVRERFQDLVSSTSVESLSDRLSYLGDAVIDAARYQSIENAPLVVFATVGTVLFFFMVRT
jgi:uncharacterized protein YerC